MNKTIITITLLASLISVFPIPDKVSEDGGKTAPPVVYAEKLPELSKAPVSELSVKPVESTARPQTNSTQPVRSSGSCLDWVQQAGITEVQAALQLIQNESGCNPNVVNKSSGACGVAQELPCNKSGCNVMDIAGRFVSGDGACQVRWMHSYVKGRYGTWSNALATWQSRSPHWY